jgi:hypothetical protein
MPNTILQWWRRLRHTLSAWLSGPAPQSGDSRTPSDALLEAMADGELLAAHALRHRWTVSSTPLQTLQQARACESALRSDVSRREEFFDALSEVAKACPVTLGELRSVQRRLQRVQPLMAGAHALLAYAASRGLPVDTAVSGRILLASCNAQRGTLSVADEVAFLDAYRALTAAMAPVTASTLFASQTRFPRPIQLLSRPRMFFGDLDGMTLGRFAHFACFAGVLVAMGVAIGYQNVGEAALTRYDQLVVDVEKSTSELRRRTEVVRERTAAVSRLNESKSAESGVDVALSRRLLQEAIDDQAQADRKLEEVRAELATMPDLLHMWLIQPQRWYAEARGAAGGGDADTAAGSPRSSDRKDPVFDARMALKRMNNIVLPMLLGLLGAYSVVLRNMSQDIRARSFEEHSFLHHVVRLSLGALAGIAAGWLLRPEQIGLSNSAPSWALAFVAGYAIELVFAFLDRIVGTFNSGKPPSGAAV